MNVRFDRGDFFKALLFAKNAIPAKQIEPVLESYYLKSLDATTVQIVATDLDLETVTLCKGTVVDEGEITIPGEKLYSLVSRLSGDTVSIETTEDASSIKVSCGAYHGEFRTLGTESYPAVTEIDNNEPIAVLSREQFLVGAKRIEFALCKDEARKNLCGLQISSKGFAATNSQAVALYKQDLNVQTFCISSNCVGDLISVVRASSSENIEIYELDAYLAFKFDANVFFTRKISINFPEVFDRFDKKTESENNMILKFKVKDLKAALSRVTITASEETKLVVFELLTDNEIRLSATDTKGFSGEEVLAVETENIEIDKPFKVGFNYDLLSSIIAGLCTEDVELKFADNIRIPVRFAEGNVVILLMQSVI